ncbi:hypothetical protein LAD12857_34740 [Lacrimispora amygdalina]|uniref:Uncharacterized protein n=1 Tax=Lacrimispora amygdalina TaxID=253257 RepID=A0ABQ5M9C4_9FIRM
MAEGCHYTSSTFIPWSEEYTPWTYTSWFLITNVAKVLVEIFGIAGISTAEDDINFFYVLNFMSSLIYGATHDKIYFSLLTNNCSE